MRAPIIVGIDYSMTSPGICIHDTAKKEFCLSNCVLHYATDKPKLVRDTEFIRGTLIDPKDYQSQEERFLALSKWAVSCFPKDALVTLEGYAFGKAGAGMVFHIGENTGILKARILTRGNSLQVVGPLVLKKMATGDTKATKKEMYLQFCKDDPEGVEILDSVIPIKVTTDIVTKRFKNGKVTRRDKGKVNSPITDLIDAYYLCKYLHSNV